jgi:hypothetical protein
LPDLYNKPLFYNGKTKIAPPIFTLNTLESMIKYILISSILDIICEMTTKLWECPRDETQLLHLQHLLEIRIWGTKWKRTIDETNEWVA